MERIHTLTAIGRYCVAVLCLGLLAGGHRALAETPPAGGDDTSLAEDSQSGEDVLDMDLDQLSRADVVVSSEMSTEVTSVSRTAQPISQTASAVFVITNEMIKRSGARNIPEALRIAPGVHVAKITPYTWAVSIRGFNQEFSNKLLIQVDGRAIYNTIYGGTSWEFQFVPLQDIDRIEVVRGPGATVWGANAVNGVINIVTKNANDTQGAYAEAGGGSEHQSFSHARMGGSVGNLAYRVYGMHVADDSGFLPSGDPQDGRDIGMGGFRMDWNPTWQDSFTFQGALLAGTNGYASPTNEVSSHFLQGRWAHKLDCLSDFSVQLYYDQFDDRNVDPALGRAYYLSHEVFDIDLTYHTREWEWHDIVAGFGFRQYYAGIVSQIGPDIYAPTHDHYDTISYFVQDTWTLAEERCFLTLGCKMEHNDFVGFVYQPTAKLAVTPNERTSLWASVSRSVRTPSRSDRNLSYSLPAFGSSPALFVGGTPDVNEEVALTYEIGMRRQPEEYLYWDAALFYSRYDDIIERRLQSASASLVDIRFDNAYAGPTYGGELWATLTMTDNWRVRAWWALLYEEISKPSTTAAAFITPAGFARNLASVTSSHDLSSNVAFDATLRYADSVASGADSYLVADLRLAYRPCDDCEIALVGQNLMDNKHTQAISELGRQSQVQSGVYGMVSWGY